MATITVTSNQISAISGMIDQLFKEKPNEEAIDVMLGTALPILGATLADKSSRTLLVQAKKIDNKSIKPTLDLLINGNVVNQNAASALGRRFWDQLYARIKRIICSNRQYMDAISRRLSNSLASLIRYIASLLGIALSVTAMSVIAAIIYKMISMGVNRFCSI